MFYFCFHVELFDYFRSLPWNILCPYASVPEQNVNDLREFVTQDSFLRTKYLLMFSLTCIIIQKSPPSCTLHLIGTIWLFCDILSHLSILVKKKKFFFCSCRKWKTSDFLTFSFSLKIHENLSRLIYPKWL